MHKYWITFEWRTDYGKGFGDARIQQDHPLRADEMASTKANIAANLSPDKRLASIVVMHIYKFEQEA